MSKEQTERVFHPKVKRQRLPATGMKRIEGQWGERSTANREPRHASEPTIGDADDKDKLKDAGDEKGQ